MSAENWHEPDDFVTAYETPGGSLTGAHSQTCGCWDCACEKFRRSIGVRAEPHRINFDHAWLSWGLEHMK